jgi:molybdate transport system ATP-binding protein
MLEVKIKRNLPGFNLDVAFNIDKEILAILGSSGSGKTMTLMCIAGLIKPDEGHISLNGRVLFDSVNKINIPTRERRVGFVFQQYALFPHLTVEENIAYGISNPDKKGAKKRVKELLELIHVQQMGKRLPRQLSSGQQQRVALARALAAEPELLLLDEPFSALDTVRKERLEMELLNLQQFYRGNMLFVTHDLAQGFKLSSRMAIFDSGQIVQFDAKEQVISAPASRIAARLAGVKNLARAKITRVNGSEVTAYIPGLDKEFRAVTKSDMKFSAGQYVMAGIRPEHIEITATEKENTVRMTLYKIVSGVTFVDCRLVNDAAAEMKVRASFLKASSNGLSEGSSYLVHFPPEHVVIVPDDSTQP